MYALSLLLVFQLSFLSQHPWHMNLRDKIFTNAVQPKNSMGNYSYLISPIRIKDGLIYSDNTKFHVPP